MDCLLERIVQAMYCMCIIKMDCLLERIVRAMYCMCIIKMDCLLERIVQAEEEELEAKEFQVIVLKVMQIKEEREWGIA